MQMMAPPDMARAVGFSHIGTAIGSAPKFTSTLRSSFTLSGSKSTRISFVRVPVDTSRFFPRSSLCRCSFML